MKKKHLIWAAPLWASALVLLWFGCVSTPYGRGLFLPHTNTETGKITYTVNPGVTNTLGRARDITRSIPMPWSDAASAVMGLTIAVLAGIAKVKSNQASVVPTLIAAVESAPNHDELKTTIKRIAEQTGVEKRLNREVRRFKTARTRFDFGAKV